LSVSCVIPAQQFVPPNWLEPSWYALYLSGQEIFTRGLASFLIKKQGTLSPADIRGTFALQNLLGLGTLILLFAAAPLVAQWYGQEQLRRFMMASAVGCYGYALRGVPLALMERNFEYGRVSIVEVLENIIFTQRQSRWPKWDTVKVALPPPLFYAAGGRRCLLLS
jgi:hypothetical protein